MIPPKSITLMTATGEYNLGDECILAEEIDFLFKTFPKIEKIFVFTYHKDSSELLNKNYNDRIEYIPYAPYNLFQHPLKNIGYAIKNLKVLSKSDWIIIGGGGIFFDTGGTRAFRKLVFLWWVRIILSRWMKKYIFLWAVSFEISEKKHTQYLHHIFSRDEILTVRDEESKKLLSEIGYGAEIIADPVIGRSIIDTRLRKKGKKVGLALRGGFLENEWENLKEIVDYLRSKGLYPVLITHSFHSSNIKENDFLYYQKFAAEYNIEISRSLIESIKLYEEISYMITIRLHGAILSASASIPFLAITYGQKTQAFPKSIDYPYWVEGKKFSESPWREYIDTIIQNEDSLSRGLKEKTQNIRKKSMEKLRFLWGL